MLTLPLNLKLRDRTMNLTADFFFFFQAKILMNLSIQNTRNSFLSVTVYSLSNSLHSSVSNFCRILNLASPTVYLIQCDVSVIHYITIQAISHVCQNLKNLAARVLKPASQTFNGSSLKVGSICQDLKTIYRKPSLRNKSPCRW